MKRIPLSRCASQWQAAPSPRRPSCLHAAQRAIAARTNGIQTRYQTTVSIPNEAELEVELPEDPSIVASQPKTRQGRWPTRLEKLPSPHPSAAERSVKLHALRSRLSLPQRFPLQTLARTLVHPSADPNAAFNNASLSISRLTR